MAKKAREAFRTISEVADWLDVPAHVLRFWESKFTQIKPVKRAGGRRYYRPSDMELIGGIKALLHDDGLTIRGVQKILKEEGVKHVAGFSQDLDVPVDPVSAGKRSQARERRRAVSDEMRNSNPSPIEEDRTSIEDAVLADEEEANAPSLDQTQTGSDAPAPEAAPEPEAETSVEPPADEVAAGVADDLANDADDRDVAGVETDAEAEAEDNIFADSETPDMFSQDTPAEVSSEPEPAAEPTEVDASDVAPEPPKVVEETPEQVPVFEHNRSAAQPDPEPPAQSEPETAPQPAALVPDDPAEGDIALDDAQMRRLAIIAKLRSVPREDHGLDDVALLRPRKRLSELRDRLADALQ